MSNQVTTLHAQRLSELASLTERFSSGDGIHDTAVKGLRCIKLSAPNARLPSAYEPSICVILQGSKRVLLDEEIYRYEPPQFLAVSVDLPLLGQVLEASEQRPYLCLQIAIDSRQISELIAQSTEHHLAGSGSTRGLSSARWTMQRRKRYCDSRVYWIRRRTFQCSRHWSFVKSIIVC